LYLSLKEEGLGLGSLPCIEEIIYIAFAHNLKEFTHLAHILPKVYAEEKDNF